MGAPPKFTAVWPETAFGAAGWRARNGSCESSESSGKGGSGRRASLLRPSKARHPHEASRLANPVVESYMTSEEYSDYRGVSYMVRTVARTHSAPLTVVRRRYWWRGWSLRRSGCWWAMCSAKSSAT